MSPDVLARKLQRLSVYLRDLASHRGRGAADIRQDPYAVERLLELLVQVGVDILMHLLAERGIAADSYRSAFVEAGAAGLLPEVLAARLADAAGLRNVQVHLYEEVDYDIVAASVDRALTDFDEFGRLMQKRLDAEDGGGTIDP